MSVIATLTADDLWPLVRKLPHEEQVRLAKLALDGNPQQSRRGVMRRPDRSTGAWLNWTLRVS
jgi:hypothetical protein